MIFLKALMMKKIIKNFLYCCIKVLRLFYNLKVSKRISIWKTDIRSMWLYPEFKEIGDKVSFGSSFYLEGGKCITIGCNVYFASNCVLTAWDKHNQQRLSPSISIGNNCSFGENNHITSTNSISIGDGFLSGKWVTITDNSHGATDLDTLYIAPHNRQIYSKGPVVIGKNVWVGDKATILPGVTIGDGVVIAANTVVSCDVPPYCVAVGSSCKILKRDDLCQNQD